MPTDAKKFDPNDHIMSYKGKPYLECKYRLHWMRVEKPGWGVSTELLRLEERIVGKGANAKPVPFALFKATVFDETGKIVATGHGSETSEDFGDWVEKAETKGLARALASAGFGTLQSLEWDEGTDADGEINLADSPGPAPKPKTVTHAATTGIPTTCSECGDAITGYTATNGTKIGAEEVIKKSVEKFQKPLCKKCYVTQSNPVKASA